MTITSGQMTSESGHWYHRDGRPAYRIVGKNGVERDTTLRDARQLNLVPSVTTITACAAAPGLERWKQEQVLLAALTLPRMEGELEHVWVRRVWVDSHEQALKAAQRGTEIHGAIERHLRGETVEPALQPWVDAAMAQVDTCFGKQSWSPEKSFAHPLGYGGKVDLHSTSNRVVVDFKTKDGPLSDVKVYDTHHMQLAAYARGLWDHTSDEVRRSVVAAVIFVRRDKPEADTRLLSDADLDSGWQQFYHLLRYWQAKTGHR